MRSGRFTCNHFVQPQRGIGGFCLGNNLDAGAGTILIDLIDEIAAVAAKAFAARVSIRTIREGREANCASLINRR